MLLRSPSLRIESNPLEAGLAANTKKTENIAGAVPISAVELGNIIKLMKIMGLVTCCRPSRFLIMSCNHSLV